MKKRELIIAEQAIDDLMDSSISPRIPFEMQIGS